MTNHRWQENNVKTDSDVWDKETEPNLEGKLVKIERNVGPNESTMYSVEKEDGAVLKVWGSTVLDDRFLGVPEGTYIKVTYEGKLKSKKGTEYHSYKVFIDLDSMPQNYREEQGEDNEPLPEEPRGS